MYPVYLFTCTASVPSRVSVSTLRKDICLHNLDKRIRKRLAKNNLRLESSRPRVSLLSKNLEISHFLTPLTRLGTAKESIVQSVK